MTAPKGDAPDWLQPAAYVYSRIFGTFLAGGGSSISVGQWASVHVLLGNIDHTSLLSAVYQFVDSASGFIIDEGILSADASDVNPQFPAWNLPVVADTLILFPIGATVIAEVIATNRLLNKGMAGDYQGVRSFQGSVPATSPSGTRVALLGQQPTTHNAISQANLSNFNGQVMYVFLASGAITGAIQSGVREADGTLRQLSLFFNPGVASVVQIGGHPFAFTSWSFITTAISPGVAVAVQIQVYPAESAP